MSNRVSPPRHPSPPYVVAIERRGGRYAEDVVRQSRTDAERGGWLVAKDAASSRPLWSAQLCANPYDATSPVGSPPRWFQRMRLTADSAGIEIEDDIGTVYLVDLATLGVTARNGPFLSRSPRGEDKRPRFD